MWNLLAQIGTSADYLYYPVADNGCVWFFWPNGIVCVFPQENRALHLSFPVAALPSAVGSNGRNVIACYDESLMSLSPDGSRLLIPEGKIPSKTVAISPYHHDCFSAKEIRVDGIPTYFYHHCGDFVVMSVGQDCAVLVDTSSHIMKIGRGKRVLGVIGIPAIYANLPHPLVGNGIAGCVPGDYTVIVFRNWVGVFKAVGGVYGNVLALVSPGAACVVDFSRKVWEYLTPPPIVGSVQGVAVCPKNGQYYIVCVEGVHDFQQPYVNVWGTQVPPMTRGWGNGFPIQYKVMSAPFEF